MECIGKMIRIVSGYIKQQRNPHCYNNQSLALLFTIIITSFNFGHLLLMPTQKASEQVGIQKNRLINGNAIKN